MTTRNLWILITAIGIIPAAAIGYWLGTPEPEPVPAREFVKVVEEQPDPEFPALHRGPRPPGEWAWRDLRGGECIESYTSAWEERYTVVDCDTEHQAEFVRAIVIDSDRDAPYPGDEALAELASRHCERFEREELNNPEQFDDLIAEVAYSLGEEAWSAGDRLLGCFVTQKDRGVFTEQLIN